MTDREGPCGELIVLSSLGTGTGGEASVAGGGGIGFAFVANTVELSDVGLVKRDSVPGRALAFCSAIPV